MAIQFSMPLEQESTYTNKQEGGTFNKVKLFRPMPDTTNSQFTNELFIPLYQPELWKIFNYSQATAERLGLNPVNPIAPVNGQSSIYTFYFTIPVHGINNFVRGDGSEGFTNVICPVKFNEYLTNALQRQPMFKNPRCAHCEASQLAWGDHNKRWAQLKTDNGIDKKSLNKDGYKQWITNDPVLKETHTKAKNLTPRDQNILIVYDHGKICGSKKLAEGENTVEYEVWFSPKGVVDNLKEFFRDSNRSGDHPFFSFDNPAGFEIIKVIKKVGRDKRQDTEYTTYPGKPYAYDEAYKQYLSNISGMPDPSDLLTILTYEEMQSYLPSNEQINVPVNGTNVGHNSAINVPQAPVAPQVPQMTPNFTLPGSSPQAPQAFAAPPAPVAPSVPVAPTLPVYSAPIPAAPLPMPPVVPAAPPIPPNMMPGVPQAPAMPSAPQVPKFTSPSPQAPAMPSAPQVPKFTSPSPQVPAFAPDRTPPASDDSGDTSW